MPDDLETCQRELVHTRSVLAETAVACEEQATQIEKLRAELELFQRPSGDGKRSLRNRPARPCPRELSSLGFGAFEGAATLAAGAPGGGEGSSLQP